MQPLLQVQPTQIQVQVQTPQIPYAPFDASIHTPPQSSNPQQNYFAQPDASTAISRDPRCKAFARDNTCIECSKGYLLTVTKKCKLINQLCAESDPKDGSCTKCYNGYRLEHGKCIVKLADPNCKEFVDNICKTCSNGYYLNKENRCTMFNPQCATADQTTGNCLTCYKGYLLKDGKCIMGSQDANCRLFENGQCKACNTGYFSNNGKCTQASTLCATFDPNNGNCLTCYNGYMLSGATCVVGTADPNCREYQNRQCSKCSNGFFVKQGNVLRSQHSAQSLTRTLVTVLRFLAMASTLANAKWEVLTRIADPSRMGCANLALEDTSYPRIGASSKIHCVVP